jgi:hypothetical protein
MSAYVTSPIRRRRTRAEIDAVKAGIFDIVAAARPTTVRHVFYRGVGLGLWPKTEAAYRSTVCRLSAEMRRGGELPYSWIADNTRWMRRPTTWSSAGDALADVARTYRRSLWEGDRYLELWSEKEATTGVVLPVTDRWDVPLMVTRGYPSLSFLHSAAEVLAHRDRDGQEVTLLYLGDHDPSGDDIAANVAARLADMSGCGFDFVRVAVTVDQIDTYDLPTRPTKQTDSRARNWSGTASVEVDALDPNVLRALLEAEIEARVDREALEVLRAVEAEEREMLHRFAQGFGR